MSGLSESLSVLHKEVTFRVLELFGRLVGEVLLLAANPRLEFGLCGVV